MSGLNMSGLEAVRQILMEGIRLQIFKQSDTVEELLSVKIDIAGTAEEETVEKGTDSIERPGRNLEKNKPSKPKIIN